jgi:hypothetical protein
MMAEVAGSQSHVHWVGTFGWILLPGVLVGALLGWASHLRATGGRRGWRWLALSPLLFAALLFSNPMDMAAILEDGVGGGAIAIPLIGMAGGFALSGRGPLWARLACGLLPLATIPAWALTAGLVGGPGLALSTPRGAWVAAYLWSFVAVLALASAIPHLSIGSAVGAVGAVGRSGVLRLVAAGAVVGLAWACALREYMAQLAGPESSVTWLGTHGAVCSFPVW